MPDRRKMTDRRTRAVLVTFTKQEAEYWFGPEQPSKAGTGIVSGRPDPLDPVDMATSDGPDMEGGER